jgi:aryl-alcohol dehydrogenase-like predicted oxidoreductase
MKESNKKLSRRQFVSSVAALSGAALLSTCSKSGGPSGIVSNVSLNPSNGASNPGTQRNLALPTRKLGKTDLDVTTLSFGGGSAFMAIPDGTWQTVIQRAYDVGIKFFDTANEYNVGASETRFGDFFSVNNRRQNVLLSTKLNLYSTGTTRNYTITKAAAEAELDASLARMKTTYLDFLFLHAINTTDDIDKIGSGIWSYFKDFKAAGKARFIGFSSMDSGAKAQEFINKLDPDICILALSVTGYKAYSTLALPAAVAKNTGVMAIKLCKGIVDATPKPLATPLECFSWP